MISRDEAVSIARARALQFGWSLREPVSVVERRNWDGTIRSYAIASDPTMRGTRSHFAVDATSGAILREGYVPR